MLVRSGTAAVLLGVCTKTLRRWDALEQLKPGCRTSGGHRRYDTAVLYRWLQHSGAVQQSSLPEEKKERSQRQELVVGYARVSATKQRSDLQRQQEQIRSFCQQQGWHLQALYHDIASGLNDRRRGLRRLVAHCQTTPVTRVVITYDDRLSRFGTGLIEWWLRWWAVEVVRVGPVNITQTLEQRLLEDLLALMTSFTGRFHRLRRSKKEQEPRMPGSTARCGS